MKNCPESKFVNIFGLLLKPTLFDTQFIQSCFALNPEFFALLKIAKLEKMDVKEIKKILGESGLEKNKQESVVAIFQENIKIKNQKKSFVNFIEAIKFLYQENNSREEVKQTLLKLEGIPNIGLELISKAAVYFKVGNDIKAFDLVHRFLNLDIEHFILNDFFLTEDERKIYFGAWKSFFDYLSKKKHRLDFTYLLYLKLKDLMDESLAEQLKEYDKDWSLVHIREKVKTLLYGKKLVGFWYPYLTSRVTSSEAEDFLKNMISDSKTFESIIEDMPWLLTFGYPPEQEKRDLIAKTLSLNEKSHYERYVLLRLFEGTAYKKDEKKGKVPLFIRKRKFFLELFEQKKIIEFPILNLVSLGDVNTSYLWWVLFSRF